jgi:uncharacterized membrane protein YgdD (TMEM256/DUF423 family)
MHKAFLATATLLGALSVALGAFGAHALKERVDANALNIFETAVRYQFYHVFALLAVAIIYQFYPNTLAEWSGRCFIIGMLLFSGSLYLLTYFKSQGLSQYNWVGAITPIGGLAFIAGWLLLFFAVRK